MVRFNQILANVTVRLEKAIGSKGKQPCKRTASETQTHGQSFQKIENYWNCLEIGLLKLSILQAQV